MYLLGTVLSHFLSLYASVNSFHMLTVVNTESQETWKWTERTGQHPLLRPGNPRGVRKTDDPLAQVFHNACSYNFFAMAELLHRLAKGEKGTPELSLRDDPAQETLRFSADASLAFPCSDISALKRDTSGAFRMTTTFMGLQGSQYALCPVVPGSPGLESGT